MFNNFFNHEEKKSEFSQTLDGNRAREGESLQVNNKIGKYAINQSYSDHL